VTPTSSSITSPPTPRPTRTTRASSCALKNPLGYDLAYLASVWEQDDDKCDERYEFVRRGDLPILLLSFDLRLKPPPASTGGGQPAPPPAPAPAPGDGGTEALSAELRVALDEMFATASGGTPPGMIDFTRSLEELVSLSPEIPRENFIERIEFVVEDDDHKYKPGDAASGLHQRTIKGDQVQAWLDSATKAAKTCEMITGQKVDPTLFLTIPLVKPDPDEDFKNPKFLDDPKFPDSVRVRGFLVLTKGAVTANSPDERTLEFYGIFPDELSPDDGDKKASCGWIKPKLGGRYPVTFQLGHPRAH
jgi:hypothetical protein